MSLTRQDEAVPLRIAYGKALVNIGRYIENIVVLDADVSKGTYTYYFKEEFPSRFFNFGIAEQNMMGVAAGLSTIGYIPFVNTYAVFAVMRACEQVRTSVAYPRLNVKIAGGHGGISVGPDGATHQAIEDIAITRAIPNIVILVPADPIEVEKVVEAAARYYGPVYIRLARMPISPIFDKSYEFSIGKAVQLLDGEDVTVFACGVMIEESLKAVELLKHEGISTRLINVSTIKPIDKSIILKSARETGALVTVEDHNIIGGLGSAVAEILSEECPTPLVRVGLRDTFGESGDVKDLFDHYELSYKHIKEAVKRVIKMKRRCF